MSITKIDQFFKQPNTQHETKMVILFEKLIWKHI